MGTSLPVDPLWATWRTFADELRVLGYVEGRNLLVRVWSLLGRSSAETRAPVLGEILAADPDIIVTRGSNWIRQLKAATTTIPMVVFDAEPIEQDIVQNLARPEANVTGFSSRPGPEFNEKLIQLLVDLVPTIRRVGWVGGDSGGIMPDNPGLNASIRARVIETLAGRGVTVVAVAIPPVPAGQEAINAWMVEAMSRVEAESVDGLMFESGSFIANPGLWASLLLEAGLPSITVSEDFVSAGGLASYSSDTDEIYRGMARYTDQILRGAKPSDLPFQLPSRFSLLINGRTAAALGLTIPEPMRLMATEIVE
jgi:putative ABC transport system substrate-binding protein